MHMALTLGSKTFHPEPNIGHCITLKSRGIDLLGIDGDAQLAKMIANPIDFLSVLEVLIADEANGDDQFQMPQLAAFMKGGKWLEARAAVLESFSDFFRDNGYPQLASGMARMKDAADMMTTKVSESLESGELRKKMDNIVTKAIEDLEAIDEEEPTSTD